MLWIIFVVLTKDDFHKPGVEVLFLDGNNDGHRCFVFDESFALVLKIVGRNLEWALILLTQSFPERLAVDKLFGSVVKMGDF